MRTSAIFVALLASVALVNAAGGIKGLQRQSSGIKGPRAPVSYQPLPPPPPPPAPVLIQQEFIQPPPLPPPRPILPAPVKGPGQVTPIFSAIRVQQPFVALPLPLPPPPAPLPVQQPIIQQEEVVQQQEQEPEPSADQQQPVQQQQQQQETEQDPPAAAQDPSAAIAVPAGPASAEEANPAPEPYAFNYAFNSGDAVSAGSSAREEQQDASGRVTGFYTLRGEDGRDRRVDYVADANGFRATISTNEMGTAPKDSADVDWNAQAPTDAQLRVAEAATQAARQRAAFEPAQPVPQASFASAAIQQQQQQRDRLAQASGPKPNKVSSPRQNGFAPAGSKQPTAASNIAQQLREPFEPTRKAESSNIRGRKSRQAPL